MDGRKSYTEGIYNGVPQMTKSAIKKSMRRLPVTDRLELMEDLEISIAEDEERIPLHPWQRKIIDKRLAEYRKNPSNVIGGEEFKSTLKSVAARMRNGARKKNG